MAHTVLIVDDEKHTREGLSQALEDEYDVYLAASAEEAFNLLAAQEFEVVLTDLRMPGKNGLKVIEQALAHPRRPVVIMMTAYGTVETAVEAMKRGAFDFLTKPVDLARLEVLIKRAIKSREAAAEAPARPAAHAPVAAAPSAPAARSKPAGPAAGRSARSPRIVGTSAALRTVMERVALVAPSRTTVLIEGETGTGKELVAEAIHAGSPRASGPFMAVHCAALPSSLLESELFGHEKGAFTGAAERRMGRFEAADGGTLFLDEIGEIGLATQVKLLRFLETRSLERIGSLKSVPVDVRLVAATHRNLEQMVREGTFREDLLYRLNVVKVQLPALRERGEDIPELLRHFAVQFASENGVPEPVFEAGALAVLARYPWPGNIRELRNFVENAVVLNRSGRVTEYDLEPKFRAVLDLGGTAAPASGAAPAPAPLLPTPGAGLSVAEHEKRLLREALLQARGNRTRAAELMGISRRTLHRKLAQFPELDVVDKP